MSDYEAIPSDSFLEPTRYRLTLRCLRCGRKYSKIVDNAGVDDPPCPRKACVAAALEEEIERRARNMARILRDQQPPGHIGEKVIVKAIDETARVVMEDYHVADLKDGIRRGETMAPKLAPPLQAQADGFFGGTEVKRRNPALGKRQMDALGRRAIAGAFRNMAVDPASVTPGQRGEPALRMVRREPLK